MTAIVSSDVPHVRTGQSADCGLALVATVLVLVAFAIAGFPSLTDARGDNDSLLRLVQVRDLIGGQGWFDPTQYRMGLEGGFAMHWSRLVDLPIAAIILAATALGASQATAETAAMIVWPLGLFAAGVFLVVRIAREVGGAWAVLPAAVVSGGALYYLNIFAPGALDHHNLQLVLALATVHFLIAGLRHRWGAAYAGVSAALMLAIGMETAPYVAAAGLCAATAFLAGGPSGADFARRYGLGFAGATAACFLAAVSPQQWLAAQCDALSIAQMTVAGLAGVGLAAIASLPMAATTISRRFALLAGLGGAIVLLLVIAFPQCLGNPYADLDPRLQRYWLSSVTEAQSIRSIVAAGEYGMLAASFATPFLALAVIAWKLVRSGLSRGEAVLLVFLSAAILVSLWQVRGSMFSVPFAAIVLAVWIGQIRKAAAEDASPLRQVGMAAAWLASFNIVWSSAAGFLQTDPQQESHEASTHSQCYRDADYATLAALPAGLVAAVSNQGAAILRHTPHRVLSGPYHRNVDGNLLGLDLFMGPPAESEALARAVGVDYLVLCRGNPETGMLAGWGPEGVAAHLVAGNAMNWLKPLQVGADDAIEIFRVIRR